MYGFSSTVSTTPPVSGHITPTAASTPVVTRIRPRPPTWVDINTVLICDEPEGAKKSLTRVLAAIRPDIVVSRATGSAELLETYRRVKPDLVLVGIRRGILGDPDPAQQLLRAYPAARVIVFGTLADARAMIGDIAHGAAGLLMWEPSERKTPVRIDATTLPPTAMARRTGHRGGKPTERELQILRGMSEGQSNGEIGRELFLSEDTVKTHARRLFQKLGARDRAHAVALGMRCGLVA